MNPDDLTLDDLANAAIAALKAGTEEPARCYLVRTNRRDVVEASSRHATRAGIGRVIRTVYRLNGDRISQHAADLLIRAYGGSRTPVPR